MTTHLDGAVLSKARTPWGTTRLAFGWLGPDSGFSRGDCPGPVLVGLEDAARHPVDRTRGWHLCPFCETEAYGPTTYRTRAGDLLSLGDASLAVPVGRQQLWVAPTLVLHYVGAHDYLPPAAVLGAFDRDDAG